jgi:hypothetical protein
VSELLKLTPRTVAEGGRREGEQQSVSWDALVTPPASRSPRERSRSPGCGQPSRQNRPFQSRGECCPEMRGSDRISIGEREERRERRGERGEHQEESLVGGLQRQEADRHRLGLLLDPVGVALIFAIHEWRIFTA